jgi:hypothetical protein
MAITETDLQQAEERMRERLEGQPRAVEARYDRRVSRIVVTLDNGLELAFPPRMAEGLADAKAADLMAIEITSTGLGLHWPRLDADLYLPSLLAGVFGSPAWMATQFGRSGGRARSEAKAAAARENGRKGGRPRKLAAASS